MRLSVCRSLCHPLPARSPAVRRVPVGSMPPTRSAKAISLSHQERTATEPRQKDLHTATVETITDVNDRIKTFRLTLKDKNGFNVRRPTVGSFPVSTSRHGHALMDKPSSCPANGSTSLCLALSKRAVSASPARRAMPWPSLTPPTRPFSTWPCKRAPTTPPRTGYGNRQKRCRARRFLCA